MTTLLVRATLKGAGWLSILNSVFCKCALFLSYPSSGIVTDDPGSRVRILRANAYPEEKARPLPMFSHVQRNIAE